MAVTIKDVAALAGVPLPPCPEPVKIIHPSAKKRKNVSERLWRNWGMSRISRQAILPLRIRVPLASFSPLPPKKSMRTPSIWKQSRESAIIVMADSI